MNDSCDLSILGRYLVGSLGTLEPWLVCRAALTSSHGFLNALSLGLRWLGSFYSELSSTLNMHLEGDGGNPNRGRLVLRWTTWESCSISCTQENKKDMAVSSHRCSHISCFNGASSSPLWKAAVTLRDWLQSNKCKRLILFCCIYKYVCFSLTACDSGFWCINPHSNL